MTAFNKTRAIARNKARTKCNAMARCNVKNLRLTDSESSGNFQPPNVRWGQREQTLVFLSQDQIVFAHWFVRTRISWQNWRVLWFLWILPRLAHESCIKRCSPPDRRSDKHHTCCQQWHVHACCTYTQWFSVPQSFVCFQSECSVWTCTPETHRYLESWRALREWLKKTIHVILWHKVKIFHHVL